MLGVGASRDLPTVLIIDDDMVSREVMATVLTMTGYTIHTAPQGEAAIELLDAGACKPEVILMDAQMPGLKGPGLVKELRARSNASIYAMSGSDLAEDLTRVVDGHLWKPFGPQALQELIEQRHALAAVPAEYDAPVIKLETLAQLRGLMPASAVREIYAAVVDDVEKRAADLERSLAARDTQEIKRIGHAIKGGASMAGAMQASRVGAQLEAGGDELDNVPALMEQLKAAGRNLRRMLESEFPAQK
jgi:CheY-like chemotaxis protein/HPt (histidine-containing phosphotransfer) domain-containing protein